MNTGLQDAANLGWKLAMVLRGHARAELLDTYDEERHPVHAAVRHGTDRMFRTFVVRNPVLKLARDVAARTVVPRAPVQRRLAENLSGLAVNYRHARWARAPTANSSHGVVRAGDRLPDVELWTAHRSLIRLYQVLREPGYTLFVYAKADGVEKDRARIVQLVQAANGVAGDWLRPRLVLDEGVLDDAEIGAPVYVDIADRFAGKLGARRGSVLLARPDGYLAAHRAGFDRAVLSAAPCAASAEVA
jgi:FAD binding domain